MKSKRVDKTTTVDDGLHSKVLRIELTVENILKMKKDNLFYLEKNTTLTKTLKP